MTQMNLRRQESQKTNASLSYESSEGAWTQRSSLHSGSPVSTAAGQAGLQITCTENVLKLSMPHR